MNLMIVFLVIQLVLSRIPGAELLSWWWLVVVIVVDMLLVFGGEVGR